MIFLLLLICRRRRYVDDDDMNKRRDRRYNDHRRPSNHSRDYEEDTPEWFTEGPTRCLAIQFWVWIICNFSYFSQNEYIELIGFNDHDEKKQKRERRRSKKEKGNLYHCLNVYRFEIRYDYIYCGTDSSRVSSRSNTPIIPEEPPAEEAAESEEKKRSANKPIVVEPANDTDSTNYTIDAILGDILSLGTISLYILRVHFNRFILATDELVPNQPGTGSSRLKQFFHDRESPGISNSDDTLSSRKSLILFIIWKYLNYLMSNL